jgi:cytochrome d ubiquinol oxidase subunit II
MALQTTWFFLWGLLWAIFFMTDGFDFGVGIIYPFLAKSDSDKHIMIRAIGPLWNGNEVWLIAAIGVTFAAFPIFYSAMFSSLYSPLMIVLFALIIRGVSFEFRDKVDSKIWKTIWDNAIFIGSFTPALLFGIIFTSIFAGVPIDADGVHCRNFITPYNVLGGVCFICLFIMHGILWLIYRTYGPIKTRGEILATKIWPLVIVFITIFLFMSAIFTNLYDNYIRYPILMLIILEIIGAASSIRYFLAKKEYFKSWISSAGLIFGFIFFGFIGIFPNLLKSSTNEIYNITIYNSSSSPLALQIMFIAVIIFIPIILGYQIWTYKFFGGGEE